MSDAPDVPVTFLDAQARLARTLPGYEERPQQEKLATEIEQSWENGTVLIGQAGCIQGDAEMVIHRGTEVWPIKLSQLVARFTGEKVPGSASGRRFKPGIDTYVQREVDGVVRLAKLENAWFSGRRTTYTVTTETGRTIRATDQHPFLTERGWSRLDELVVGDLVHVKGQQASGGQRAPKRSYRQVYGINAHPHAIKHNAFSSRYPLHRFVAEARLNDISVEALESRVRSGQIDGITFLDPKVYAVHHLDEDPANNDLGNLQVLTHEEHHRLHAEEGAMNHVLYKIVAERVVSVELFGEENTYDIEVADDPHNFIVNGFVVHNTGVGKSLAGLIPAILSSDRTVYTTATKALQSQLMTKDLPFLRDNLGVDFSFAMLQGKSNYFCHAQATDNAKESEMITDLLTLFNEDDEDNVKDFAFQLDGLRENLPVDVDNTTWGKMTISADECPRKGCAFYTVCRFESARHKAFAAQVVVANHALVALDGVVASKTDGKASLLGDYEHLIVDECHDLEQFLTSALTTRQTIFTYKTAASELRALMRDDAFSADDERTIDSTCMDMVVSAEAVFDLFPMGRVRHNDAVKQADHFIALINHLKVMRNTLAPYDEDDEWGEKRSSYLDERSRTRFYRMLNRLDNLILGLSQFLLLPDSEVVRLFEGEQRGAGTIKVLRVVPVRIANWAKANLWNRVLPTLISATALVDGRADFLIDQLGLDECEVTTIDVGSPFDFKHQARLYIPEHISDPSPKNRTQWEREMLPLMEELVSISRGRALLLFTSRSQLETAYSMIAPKLPYTVLKQGDASAALLTRRFREETDSVLFATRSFFQGIDIQGESLSLVVIDKLPFPVPTDPLIEARTEDIERRGGRGFDGLTIPMMTLVLQQAFGRLIRTKNDRGVVAVMDPRLVTKKSYGPKIRRSLPAPMITDLSEVEDFFAEIDG